MSHALTLEELPKTLGAFKPNGHVMVALPQGVASADVEESLRQVGFAAANIIDFSAAYSGDALESMLANASESAGFGYEITLMRRYLALARQGCHWLLVYAPTDEEAEKVKQVAMSHGAPMAVKYHLLAVEDLI